MMHDVGLHKLELCGSILSYKRGGITHFVNSPVSTPKLGWQPLLLTLNKFSATTPYIDFVLIWRLSPLTETQHITRWLV